MPSTRNETSSSARSPQAEASSNGAGSRFPSAPPAGIPSSNLSTSVAFSTRGRCEPRLGVATRSAGLGAVDPVPRWLGERAQRGELAGGTGRRHALGGELRDVAAQLAWADLVRGQALRARPPHELTQIAGVRAARARSRVASAEILFQQRERGSPELLRLRLAARGRIVDRGTAGTGA